LGVSLARLALESATSLLNTALRSGKNRVLTVGEGSTTITPVLNKVNNENVVDTIHAEFSSINRKTATWQLASSVLPTRAGETLSELFGGSI
jgi:hypothetical protein